MLAEPILDLQTMSTFFFLMVTGLSLESLVPLAGEQRLLQGLLSARVPAPCWQGGSHQLFQPARLMCC